MSLTILWLFAVLLSLFFFSLVYRERASVGWRWASGLLALGALLFPPGRWLAHLVTLWTVHPGARQPGPTADAQPQTPSRETLSRPWPTPCWSGACFSG